MSYVNRKSWKNRSSGFGYNRKGNKLLSRILIFLLLLFVCYEVITSLFIMSTRVESISMEPTIPSGAVILSSPLVYGPELPFVSFRIPGIRKPARGDIVISSAAFYIKPAWYTDLLDSFFRFFTLQKIGFGQNNSNWAGSYSVKRILGVPGDTVKMEDYVIYIKPEGNNYFFSEKEIIQVEYTTDNFNRLKSPENDFPLSGYMSEIRLGPDEYFVSGDNRAMSNDSYYWGPVKLDNIKAHVMLEYAPEIKILQ